MGVRVPSFGHRWVPLLACPAVRQQRVPPASRQCLSHGSTGKMPVAPRSDAGCHWLPVSQCVEIECATASQKQCRTTTVRALLAQGASSGTHLGLKTSTAMPEHALSANWCLTGTPLRYVPATRLAIVLIALVLATSISHAADVSTDVRFLDGLRRRELFELAETYCRGRLAENSLSDHDRAELTIQWAQVLSEHAAGAPPRQQAALWQQAGEVLDRWLAAQPESPWRPPVAMQRAMVALTAGELARQQAQVAVGREPWLAKAQGHLRDAISRLRALIAEVDRLLVAAQRAAPQRPFDRSRDDSPRTLSADELISLGRNVRYQLARAWMSQARCYEKPSADRAHGLVQAAKLLDELSGLPQGDPLVWKSRLARATCHRLLSDYASAQRALAEIQRQKPPPAVALGARAEAVRLALDQNQVDRAVVLLQTPKELAGADRADWDLARLEASLAAWQAAGRRGDSAAADGWEARCGRLVRRFEESHGTYWTRRAEMLLVSYFRHSDDLDTLIRAAKCIYLAGQLDDALAAYDKAAALAAKQGQRARALDLGHLAAMILQKQGHHRQAADRCRRLALAMVAEPGAAEVHLEAIRNMAELTKREPDTTLDSYVALLEEHLRRWPGASTVGQVRWWLAGVRRHQRDWDRAIAAYRAIPSADERFADAVDALGQCYEARLTELRSSRPPPTEPVPKAMATGAAEWFESIFQTPEGRLPERLSPAQRRAVLWAARLRLQSAGGGDEQARRHLTAALGAAADAPQQWRQATQALLVAALAGGGHIDEAHQMLDRLQAAGPGALLDVLGRLERITKMVPEAQRSRLAELQLRAVDLLARRQSRLSPTERLTLQRVHAGALAASGRTDEALRRYAALARAYPRDGQFREAYARLLAARGDRRSLEAALTEWRGIEQHSKPGTAGWFRAKYAVAELHLRLGRAEQAARIVQFLELLHPELGGPAMKRRFEELLQRCRQR